MKKSSKNPSIVGHFRIDRDEIMPDMIVNCGVATMNKKTPLQRGIDMITGDCARCPYMRLLDYPVCYCLYGVVDYSTRCPHDYVLERAVNEYDLNRDCVEYHYNLIKKFIRDDLSIN